MEKFIYIVISFLLGFIFHVVKKICDEKENLLKIKARFLHMTQAQYELGDMLRRGRAGIRDISEARKLLEKAAKKGTS